MLTKNLKTSVWDSEYYQLSGLNPTEEHYSNLSPKKNFEFSAILILDAVILWLMGLGFITYMVMKTTF